MIQARVEEHQGTSASCRANDLHLNYEARPRRKCVQTDDNRDDGLETLYSTNCESYVFGGRAGGMRSSSLVLVPLNKVADEFCALLGLFGVQPVPRVDIPDLEVGKEAANVLDILIGNVVGARAPDEQGRASPAVDPGVKLPVRDVPLDDCVVEDAERDPRLEPPLLGGRVLVSL